MEQKHVWGRVFITGANGFMGRALSARLRSEGAEVVGADMVAGPGVVQGDITQPGAWEEALTGVDTVIHTAALLSLTSGLDKAWEINVKATRDLLSRAKSRGVRRFVQVSSVGVYGYAFPDNVDETWPLKPIGNIYVDTKIAGEHIALAAHARGDLEVVVVRPCDVYGPGSKPWIKLPIETARSGFLVLPDGGSGRFAPVYIDDLVEGIVLAALTPSAAGQIYNLGAAGSVSCAEFFGYHARWTGRKRPMTAPAALLSPILETARFFVSLTGGATELGREAVRELMRPGGYSCEKAKRELGFEAKTPLEEGMRKSEEWARTEGLIASK
ncbi:NAD(P)-dependent oxidoreductase [Agrobacterium sp. T29]|uniref:NAD-dependent epimerase/dehydratase family protein n=1 Tax=Agrobacterium sp. T29 TaxID=2580515 RepID=UPI00115F2867|nr:NAD-dependent epimerase/dehydratase family protein [Agrobacterium sp. T29]